MNKTLIKLTYVSGLQEIVLDEIAQHDSLNVVKRDRNGVYVESFSGLGIVKGLRSVSNAYLVKNDPSLNPLFISRHKSVLGELIEEVIGTKPDDFKTFSLSCAGSDSDEVKSIRRFIATNYKLAETGDADLKISIGKLDTTWEVGVCVTPRPLSTRVYRVSNVVGGLNPTIAYAMNTLCDLDSASSYLNIFSGSGTLLIEAGLSNPNLKLIGFDIDGKRNAQAVDNIKKAGLVKSTHLKTADIFDKPDLGIFDIVASDLPFGMQISKEDDLEKLYQSFVDYCEHALNAEGTLVTYTTEYEILERILALSKFAIVETMDLKFLTSVDSYLRPRIIKCRFK